MDDTPDTPDNERTFSSDLDPELDQYLTESLTTPSDPSGVREHLARVPMDLARWSQLHAQAHRRAGNAEAAYRRVEGELWNEYRDKYLRIKGKATEKDVFYAVRSDPRYIAAKEAVVAAEADVIDLKGICDAQKAKVQALITMGTLIRAELSDPTVSSAPGGSGTSRRYQDRGP